MSKKFIVITSIFPPTEAVEKFAALDDWKLIVVGDKKTPPDWAHDNVIYLGPEKQEELNYEVTKLLPWNHYCRKMVGYLYAIEQGAELIADSDDDNIPYENWPALPETDSPLRALSGDSFVNIYNYFTSQTVWPRGYPLRRILEKPAVTEKSEVLPVGVWQFLANEDPDVDAIYRLTNNQPITFDDAEPLVLAKGTVSPFNSQNTIFNKQLFALLYLPSFVTFRFTDILRGFVAQPIMWAQNMHLGVGPATVLQQRNPHDYLRDFESEIPVFLHTEKVVELLSELAAQDQPPDELIISAYEILQKNDIVTAQEVELVKSWINDVRRLMAK